MVKSTAAINLVIMPSRQEVFLEGRRSSGYPSLVANKAMANEGGGDLLGEEYFNDTPTNRKFQQVLERVVKRKI
jgi:hypothetical protein